MRILKIWDADYPWDIRVEKIVNTLSKNGHCICLVCRNLRCLPSYEVTESVKIFRLPWTGNKFFNRFVSFPYFFNILWLWKIYQVARKERPDAILVRDLPLALSAVIVAKCLKVPVVLDYAENYPAMLKGRKYLRKLKIHQLFIRNAQLARIVEWITLKSAKRVIIVVEENKRRYVQKGIPLNKLYLVSNTPDLDSLDGSQRELPYEEKSFFAERYTLIYVGSLGPVRGLEMVIEAMPRIIEKIPEVHLLLIGAGANKEILERLVAKNKVSEYVTLKGWLDFRYVPQYLKAARAGIIPHLLTEHTSTTIPNKIFDYMAHGLPVIASDVAPMKRIIEEENCGVTFKANNKDDFVNAVIRVCHEQKNRFGENGRAAVYRKYNWKEDSAILLKVFDDLHRMA